MPNKTPRFPAEKLTKYPHMFPEDIAIWERFLEDFAKDYIGFDYDTKVGQGTQPLRYTPPKYGRMQDILSKYRIDVVGYKTSLIEIIEVKPMASSSAIGQVTTYVELYKRDFSPSLPVKGAIVTDWYIDDIDDLTNKLGIDYYVL